MPVFVRRCIDFEFGKCEADICSQSQILASIFFTSSLNKPDIAGGLSIKTKDYDFSVSRKIFSRGEYVKQMTSGELPEAVTEDL